MRPLTLLPLLALVACAGAPAAPPPATPPPVSIEPAPAPAPPAPAKEDPFALTGAVRDEPITAIAPGPVNAKLDKPPKGVGAPSAACAAFVKRKATGANACGSAGPLPPLDTALAESDPARRDALLADAESCTAIPAGLVRALRAELAPRECADVLVEPVLAAPPAGLSPAIHHALFGLALGARLARTVGAAPKLAPPYDRKRVVAHLQGPMRAWILEQVAAIEELSKQGIGLALYGKGVVAIEAGLAEMRFVDAVRSGPIPDEFLKDPELKNLYFSVLDEALEPRKARGRDAALVGLRELAFAGVIRDDRVDRARRLLSELYGGRRVDALDGLLLPPPPPAQPTTAEERVAAKLPTFYAGLLLDPECALRPGTLRGLLERGIPVPERLRLRAASSLPADVAALYARARLELGRLYWRAYDFDQAASLASDAGKERPADVTAILATALALRGGPEDVAQLMHRAPLEALGMGQVGALDALASAEPAGPFAGMAAFDAAYVRQLAAPQGADAAYFREVAERYRKAAKLLADPAKRASAEERAKAADATADAIK
jgi:hypothetical protein